ncbi:MAG TPA: peptidylprolyl isomerase [Stellaceae bacterium]|jgi:peptidyl-prolyl cis-trans isomerase SurA|nr:peptidylprolyl isomerase [Stellaceae bacterium]
MKWLLGLGFVLALACAGQAFVGQAPVGQAWAQETRIAAVVNNDIITADDVDARLMLLMRTSGIPDTPQNRQQLQRRVLQQLIDEKLEVQEAKRYKVVAGKDEVDRALGNIEQRNGMQKGGLDQYLKQAGIPRSTLVDQLTASIIWNKVVEGRYASDVSVSDTEVNDEIARLKGDMGKPQSHVAEIFLAIDNPTQEADIKGLADKLITQIRGGAQFPAVAQQFSQSPSAATGGDIGWVTPSQFGPPLDDAIAKMNPGEMSYPIRTSAGYYILYLIDRRTPGTTSADDTTFALVEVILPVAPNAPPAQQQKVMAQAQNISDTAKSCEDMAKIAREQAPQTSTQSPNVRAGDLPPDVKTLVLGLKVSEPSKPLPTRGGIGVIMVCKRTDPSAALPTTDQVYDELMHARLDQISRRYLRDLRRSAYVDIRG